MVDIIEKRGISILYFCKGQINEKTITSLAITALVAFPVAARNSVSKRWW